MNNRVKSFREFLNIAQQDLSEMTSISQKRISQIENLVVDPLLTEIVQFLKVFDCKFEELFPYEEGNQMAKNLLIRYKHREEGHVDPNFTYLVYGDSGKRASRLKNIVSKDSFVFFHTAIGGKDYITAYFKVDKILNKGQDDIEINLLQDNIDAKNDETIILGKRDGSKILTSPLLFDKKLAIQLISLGITAENFNDPSVSELSVLTSATREHRELLSIDTKILIDKCIGRG